MFCQQCGIMVNQESQYCPNCGVKMQDEHLDKTTNNKKSTKKRKAIIISLIAIMLLIGCIVYFNSTWRLERILTSNKWYLDTWDSNAKQIRTQGEVIEFRVDGSGVVEKYYIPEIDFGIAPRIYNGSYNIEWDILSDKTLFYNGHYYKYKTEWFFKNGDLFIANNQYANFDRYGYSNPMDQKNHLLTDTNNYSDNNTFTVPNFVGRNFQSLSPDELKNFYGEPELHYQFSQEEVGTIIAQDPKFGKEVKIGQKSLVLTLSKGPQTVELPKVDGMQKEEQIVRRLENAKLVVKTYKESSKTVPEGYVIRIEPATTPVAEGTTVYVYVSTGLKEVAPPQTP